MSSTFSEKSLGQQISNTLGQKLSDQELEYCLAGVEILKPPMARQFWQATEANYGIYIVLGGKVRLLDSCENLITTLTTGSSFGEMTLFPKEDFQPYAARSSHNLKLCYLGGEVLQALLDRYSSIRDRLYRQAELRDLLFSYHQRSQEQNRSGLGILKAISLFERLHLEVGSLSEKISEDSQLLLLGKGELCHDDGRTLTPGDIYHITDNSWQVTQPTIAYSLKKANVQTALKQYPELSEWIDSDDSDSQMSPPKSQSKQLTRNRNIIPFPQRQPPPKQQPKTQRPYFPTPKVKAGHWWGRLVKSYPFFAQHSSADCGAACLVMIGRYWGKNFSVNRLRELANVNRSGASLRALATVAESVGFIARPVKASLDKLEQQSLPAIAHWEGNHYIVVYEITKKRVIVCDPGIGQRNLTHEQFLVGWTGYALLLQPTAELKKAEESQASWWRFWELVKPHSSVLLEIFAASVLVQVFGLVIPLFTQLLFDRVIVQGSIMALYAVGLGLIIFSLFRIAINGLRQYLLDHTAHRVSIAMLVGFIKHTFGLPLAFFESRFVGDIVSRIEENEKIQRFLTGEALSIILDLMTVVVYLGMMFWYNWRMTLLVLMIVPPFFILALISTSLLRRMSREIFNAGAKENSYLIEALTGIRSIRSMAIEQTVRWRWEEMLNNLTKKGFAAEVVGNQLEIASATIETLVNSLLLLFGAWLVIHNELTIGQLIAFNMLLGNVISPFQRLSLLWNQLQETVIAVERINDVLEAELEEDLQNQPRRSLEQLHGHIRFDNVTFRYHPESENNILENLSFEILPEQTVAVVGRSGSGKTTLSKLILGLYPPNGGKLLIDGQDITNISLRTLRGQIGVVDQDTFLFGGTIRENISIAHPEATLDAIIEAAHLAGADDFIQQMPMGYETQIGEGGGMLSGGQRQRLAIARALLGNPRLLIFDEATSHLDSESERIIQNNLKTILQGRTSLIIAHRLSTIRNADLILVLDRGILVESGSHDELIAKKGHYFYLNQQQLASAS